MVLPADGSADLAGYIDLGHWTGIAWVGGGQFRKLAVLSCGVMAICVGVTCYTQQEIERAHHWSKGIKWGKALQNIKESVRDLSLEVRRVCYGTFLAMIVQAFADASLQSNSSPGQRTSRFFSTGGVLRRAACSSLTATVQYDLEIGRAHV